MQHLISIDDLSITEINNLIKRALYLKICPQEKYPNCAENQACTLFYENSTRTYMSFTLAAKRCKLPILSLNMQNSSEKKGESFLDTILSLHAMGIQLFIIRHEKSHILLPLLNKLPATVKLISAGDGQNEHPSQALLDLMTITEHYKDVRKLKISVIGNIKHSRVAKSFKKLCSKLGINNLTFIAPPIWQSQDFSDTNMTDDVNTGLLDADVVITLRIQQERLSTGEQYGLNNYQQTYGLTPQRLSLAKPNAIILHPGPINRGVEITSELADSSQSYILKQIENGVFMRMAIIEALLT